MGGEVGPVGAGVGDEVGPVGAGVGGKEGGDVGGIVGPREVGRGVVGRDDGLAEVGEKVGGGGVGIGVGFSG